MLSRASRITCASGTAAIWKQSEKTPKAQQLAASVKNAYGDATMYAHNAKKERAKARGKKVSVASERQKTSAKSSAKKKTDHTLTLKSMGMLFPPSAVAAEIAMPPTCMP